MVSIVVCSVTSELNLYREVRCHEARKCGYFENGEIFHLNLVFDDTTYKTFQLTKNQFKRTYLLRRNLHAKKLQNQMNLLLCGFTKCQLFVKNVTEIVL